MVPTIQVTLSLCSTVVLVHYLHSHNECEYPADDNDRNNLLPGTTKYCNYSLSNGNLIIHYPVNHNLPEQSHELVSEQSELTKDDELCLQKFMNKGLNN